MIIIVIPGDTLHTEMMVTLKICGGLNWPK